MSWWWLLAGCMGPSLPDGVPQDALRVTVAANSEIEVAGRAVLSQAQVALDPTHGEPERLVSTLAGHKPGTAFVSADPKAPWGAVRIGLMSLETAGHSPVFLGDATSAWRVMPPASVSLRNSCPDGPESVTGFERRLTVNLLNGPEGTWAEAAVRVLPIVDGSPHLRFPAECWAGASCEQTPNPDACLAATQPPSRTIPVAGPVGCLLPLRINDGDEQRWVADLATILSTLGWSPSELAFVHLSLIHI